MWNRQLLAISVCGETGMILTGPGVMDERMFSTILTFPRGSQLVQIPLRRIFLTDSISDCLSSFLSFMYH